MSISKRLIWKYIFRVGLFGSAGLRPVGAPMSKLTHKGWMLFCPIYIGDVNTDCPYIVPRLSILEPVFWVATGIQELVITLCSYFYDEEYEPNYWFVITGELK